MLGFRLRGWVWGFRGSAVWRFGLGVGLGGLGRGGVSVGGVARLGKVSLVGGFNLPKSVA